MSAEREEPPAPSPERLLAEIPAGLLVLDRSGEVLLQNRRLRELMGTTDGPAVSPFPCERAMLATYREFIPIDRISRKLGKVPMTALGGYGSIIIPSHIGI